MKARWLCMLCVLVALAGFVGVSYGKTIPAQPVNLRMSVGNESSSGGPYPLLTPPPAGGIYPLATNIDYGANFSCALNYPNAKHITQAEVADAPFVVWETGVNSNNNVVFTFWDGSAWLTPAEAISLNTPAGDAGRIAICSDQLGRIHAVWHGNPVSSADLYQVWYARCDPPDYFWTTPVPACDTASADSMEDVFPTLTVDKDGNPWAVWMLRKKGITTSEAAVVANHSTDGGDTWTITNIDTLETVLPGANVGIVGGWTLVNAAADWRNGNVHVAWPDTIGHAGFSGVNYCMYDAGTQTWGPVEYVTEDPNRNYALALPSLAVDSLGRPHIVYQMNWTSEPPHSGADGTLTGYNATGPVGWVMHTYKDGGVWSPPEYIHGALVEDSLYQLTVAVCGFPSVGIDDKDNMYVVYSRPDSTDTALLYLPFDVYMSYYDGANWIHKDGSGEWLNVSMIGADTTDPRFLAGNGAMYPQITQRVASETYAGREPGAGVTWGELDSVLALPSSVYYKRVWPVTGISEGNSRDPRGSSRVSLTQNSPNPFGAATQIRYSVAVAGRVSLVVYNAAGQEVKRLVDGSEAAGAHAVFWDGRNAAGARVANGLYFYRLSVGRGTAIKRMTVLR